MTPPLLFSSPWGLGTMDSPSLPVYDLVEVAKHDQQGDAWIVIDGYVHDVTSFLVEHPGGQDVVLDHLGKDASEVFVSESIHAHGDAAFKMLSKYPLSLSLFLSPLFLCLPSLLSLSRFPYIPLSLKVLRQAVPTIYATLCPIQYTE